MPIEETGTASLACFSGARLMLPAVRMAVLLGNEQEQSVSTEIVDTEGGGSQHDRCIPEALQQGMISAAGDP